MKIPEISQMAHHRSWRWRRELLNGTWLGWRNRFYYKYSGIVIVSCMMALTLVAILNITAVLNIHVAYVIFSLIIAWIIFQVVFIEADNAISQEHIPSWRKE